MLFHHISRSFGDNHSIGQLKEQLIVFSTKWSIGLRECIVILQHIDGMMFDRDQTFKDQWVEGRWELTWFTFSRKNWIADSCVWTTYSLVYGSWLDMNTINKGPLGSIVIIKGWIMTFVWEHEDALWCLHHNMLCLSSFKDIFRCHPFLDLLPSMCASSLLIFLSTKNWVFPTFPSTGIINLGKTGLTS